VTPPAILFHGTPASNLDSIMVDGLRSGGRQHVHLSADRETAAPVGRRRRVPARVLAVNSGPMSAAGHLCYRSANGVWLTQHVPAAYLEVLS
jgi:putative RNA 2'-phosphotransferase